MEHTPFVFLLVESDIDFVIITENSCHRCAETKLGIKILRYFSITRREKNEMKKYDVAGYDISCICGAKS